MGYSKLGTLACLALVVLGALFVAGCGGGDSTGSATESTESSEAGGGTESGETAEVKEEGGSSASGGIAEAQKFVEEGLETPTQITLTKPFKKTPPSGKTLAYMNCGLPICSEVEAGLKESTKVLGWKLVSISTGSTPESVQSAWSEVVQLNPDAVVADGSPAVLYEKQLKEYAAEGGAFVNEAVAEEPLVENSINIVGKDDFSESGKWLARWAIAKQEENANSVFVNVSEFPILTTLEEAFKEEYKRLCASCKLESLTVSAAAIGKDLPSQLVSWMQKNPETNFLVPSFGDMVLGVPQALKAAGVNESVSVISQGDGPTNFEYIAEGGQEVAVPQPVQMIAWMMTDAAARLIVGEKFDESEYQVVPHQYITAENLENPKEPWPGVPGFQKQFEELWKLG